MVSRPSTDRLTSEVWDKIAPIERESESGNVRGKALCSLGPLPCWRHCQDGSRWQDLSTFVYFVWQDLSNFATLFVNSAMAISPSRCNCNLILWLVSNPLQTPQAAPWVLCSLWFSSRGNCGRWPLGLESALALPARIANMRFFIYNCVSRAPLLFLRSWVALSLKVCLSVRYPPILALYQQLRTETANMLTQYHQVPTIAVLYWPSTQLHHLVMHSWANWI